MTIAIAFIIANKVLLAVLGVAVLSEALPFLPTKANGIAQLVLNLLKKQAPPKEVVSPPVEVK